MKLNPTPIDRLMIAETEPHTDQRGTFMRLFCQEELQEILGSRNIMQANQSCTRDIGTVRGLHYQHAPHTEMKMVRCLKGKVWDVVVDLRSGSPTFLKWHAEELSSANNRMVVIPEGCAHGFQVLEADSELLYLHSAAYSSSAEGGIRPTDPGLSISWPLAVKNLSDRDLNHPLLTPDFAGLTV
jgi:dTDP-4-dehydrorhamnose 3,5-epimerase